MDTDPKTRRQFCRMCSAAGLSATFGAVLQACGGGGPTSGSGVSAPSLPRVSASGSSSAVQLTIDASSPLASPGTAAFVSSPAGNLLVARTGGADTFTALTATCTHEGCTITGYSGQSYVCPCHGSQFSTAGQVLNGPASRSLRQYQTQFANGVLTITG